MIAMYGYAILSTSIESIIINSEKIFKFSKSILLETFKINLFQKKYANRFYFSF